MERFDCEPTEQCKYYESGCYQDTHHLFKRSQAHSGLEKRFGELPANKFLICRHLHELLEHSEGWLPYPPTPVMQAVLEREQ